MSVIAEFYEKLAQLSESQLRRWIIDQYLGISRGPDYPVNMDSGNLVIESVYKYLRTHLNTNKHLIIIFEQALWAEARYEMKATQPDPILLHFFLDLFREVTPTALIQGDIIEVLTPAVTSNRWLKLYFAYRNLHVLALELLVMLEPASLTGHESSLPEYFRRILAQSNPNLRAEIANVGLSYLSDTNKPREFFRFFNQCINYYSESEEIQEVLLDNVIIHYRLYLVNFKYLAAVYVYAEALANYHQKGERYANLQDFGEKLVSELIFDRLNEEYDSLYNTANDSRWLVLLAVCLSCNRPNTLSPALVAAFLKNAPIDARPYNLVSSLPPLPNDVGDDTWETIYYFVHWLVFDKLADIFSKIDLYDIEESAFNCIEERYFGISQLTLIASTRLNQLEKYFTHPELLKTEVSISTDEIPPSVLDAINYAMRRFDSEPFHNSLQLGERILVKELNLDITHSLYA